MKKILLLSLIILASFFELKSQFDVSFNYTINEATQEVTFIPEINIANLVSHSVEWQFGDGEYLTDESPTHYYSNFSGSYHVSMTVTYTTNDGNWGVGSTVTTFKWITLTPDIEFPLPNNLLPQILLTKNKVKQAEPFDITCSISQAYSDNHPDEDYRWEVYINGNPTLNSTTQDTRQYIFSNHDLNTIGTHSIQLRVTNINHPEISEWSNPVVIQVTDDCPPSPCFDAELNTSTYIIEENTGERTSFTASVFLSGSLHWECNRFNNPNPDVPILWTQKWTAKNTKAPFDEHVLSVSETYDHNEFSISPGHDPLLVSLNNLPDGEYIVSYKYQPVRESCNWVGASTLIKIKPTLILSNDHESDLSGKSLSFKIDGGTETININGTEITDGSILVYGDWITIDKFNSEELIVSCDASETEDRYGRIIVNFPDTYESKTIYFHQSRSVYEVDDNIKLAEAANNAEDGATIIMEEGTYNVPINIIGKNITLASKFHTTNDPYYVDKTIIDAGGQGSVITIKGNTASTGTTNLIGFHLTGGDADNGGGIYASNANVEMQHVLIHENNSHTGGGIYSSNSTIVGNHITITSNDADDVSEPYVNTRRGHSIYLSNNSDITLTNSIIGGILNESYSGSVYYDLSTPQSFFGLSRSLFSGYEFDPLVTSPGLVNVGTNGFGFGSPVTTALGQTSQNYMDAKNGDFWINPESACFRAGNDAMDLGALVTQTMNTNCRTISVYPESLVFDNVILGNAELTKVVKVTHTPYCGSPLTERITTIIPKIALSEDNYTVVPKELSLAPGETKNMYITFNPQSFGNKTGRLDISTRSSTYVLQVPISGNCVTKADLTGTITDNEFEIKSGRYLNTLYYHVNNVGGTPSGASKVKYYLSLTGLLTPDAVYLGEQDINPLQPGEEQGLEMNLINIPQETGSGIYYFIAVADAENDIDEYNENNNILTKQITVIYAQPALTVNNVNILDPDYEFVILDRPGVLPGNPSKV